MCVLGKGILCIVYWRRWLYGPVYRGEGWSEWSCRLSQIHRVTKTETERKPFGFYLISGSVVHRGIYMRYMARPPAPIPSVVSTNRQASPCHYCKYMYLRFRYWSMLRACVNQPTTATGNASARLWTRARRDAAVWKSYNLHVYDLLLGRNCLSHSIKRSRMGVTG